MKVLITGSDGFIGSHLVEQCLEAGFRVRAFVLYNSFGSWGWLDTFAENVLSEVEVVAGDIRDPNGVRRAVQDTDIVIHLAALIGIPFSYHSPDSYIDTNIKGTLNILQACRDYAIRKVVITSTSEVYGTARYVPIDEQHPYQGQSPYSASKIGADRLAESFYRSFHTPVVIARPFNTYGPRQSLRAIIPTVIGQLLKGMEKIKLGSLHPTRDLNYVKDICAGFIRIIQTDTTIGEEINIASGKEISMGDLAKKIIGMINPAAAVECEDERVRPEKSEVERLLGSNTKMQTLTGWKPRYDLDAGLRETISWFQEYGEKYYGKSERYHV